MVGWEGRTKATLGKSKRISFGCFTITITIHLSCQQYCSV